MTQTLTRRAALGSVLSFMSLPALAQEDPDGVRELQPRTYDDGLIPNFSFEIIELSLQGALGVYALDTETGRASGWAENTRAPLNSTFKLLLAAMVLRRVDTGAETLERRLRIRASDIVSWSPSLQQLVGENISIGQLCFAAMTRSDNAAANLLLQTMGGPGGLTAALRDIGDETTRVDRFETDLNDVAPGDIRDTTTPMQMVRNLDAFLHGTVLSAPSRELLLSWLRGNMTGDHRIRAGTPAGWPVGDRTGTGPRGETSTVAVIYPPGRQPLILAVYLRGSPRAPAQQDEIHAELARIATTNVMLPRYHPHRND